MNMKIAIGADHGGVELKSEIIEYFKEKGYTYTDYGTYSAASVDYPDIGLKVAEAIKNKEADRGIVICRDGHRHRHFGKQGAGHPLCYAVGCVQRADDPRTQRREHDGAWRADDRAWPGGDDRG